MNAIEVYEHLAETCNALLTRQLTNDLGAAGVPGRMIR